MKRFVFIIFLGLPIFSQAQETNCQSNLRHKDKETQIFGMTMRRIEGKWTVPEISPYFVEKAGAGWSEPRCMDLIAQFPELKYAYALSFTSNGTLYFFGHADGLGSMNDFGSLLAITRMFSG